MKVEELSNFENELNYYYDEKSFSGNLIDYEINTFEFDLFEKGKALLGAKVAKFDDIDSGGMKLTEQLLVIRSNDLVQIQSKVNPKGIYTHTRNRRVWTGPYLQWRIMDNNGLVLLDWTSGQINLICQSRTFYHRKDKTQGGIYSSAVRASLTQTSYRYVKC